MKHPSLKRELGLWQATIIGVGIILGAGIYVLMGEVVGIAGNAAWISVILASAIAALTGLSYAELSSMFPRAGAEYTYADNAFNRKTAFVVGWLMLVGFTIAASAVSLGFAGYFSALFGVPALWAAAALIILCSFVVYLGIKESVAIGILFTLIEAAGLFFIIFVGIPRLGSVDYFATPSSFSGIFTAAALVFFAFIGFEELVKLSEETKDPRNTIPKAVILSIVIVTIIYALVAISSVSVMDWQALGASAAPLADVAAIAVGAKAALIISVIALFSTSNTVLFIILSVSRLAFGMGRDKSLPSVFAKVHSKRRTPWVAILLIALFSVLFLFAGSLGTVANMVNFTLFVVFFFMNLAVIMLRYKAPEVKRSFKVPLNIGKFPVIPLVGALSAVFMLAHQGGTILFYGGVLTVVGVILSFIHKK